MGQTANFWVKTIISEMWKSSEGKKERGRGEGGEGAPVSLQLGMGAERMGRWMTGAGWPATGSHWRPFRVNKLAREHSLASKGPQLLVLLPRVTR